MSFINSLIARHIGYPLQDLYTGTSITKILKFLKESQFWDENRIVDYQLCKLKSLIDYSKRNVPYYDHLFTEIKLSSNDIKSLDDLSKIPILTKEIMRKEGNRLISREFNKFRVKKGKTGGTTGSPIDIYKDVANRSFTWASYFRWYDWMGINYFDFIVSFWGQKTVLSFSEKEKIFDKFKEFLNNQITINSFNLTEERMSDIYKLLMVRKPVLIKGYLSSLLEFAIYLQRKGLQIHNLKAISTTTETLLPQHREFLQNIYNAPVYDQYGCGEISAIAYECSHHNGLHVNQEHVICEVLDHQDNSILNKSGRVIGTDLDNLIMPFIRFETGDLATLSNMNCTCGVKQPLLISIEGRSIDTILLNNGVKVHGVFFTDILYEIGIGIDNVQRFQVVQSKDEKVEFRIEVKTPLKLELKNVLLNKLNLFFTNVDIIETSKLKNEPNGKFKFIKSELFNENTLY